MNLATLPLPALLNHKRLVDAEVRARKRISRPKKVKPKCKRKVRSAEEIRRALLYKEFRQLHEFCWACGRTENDRPAWYGGEVFMLERAHIVNQPRIEDVRVIVCLCSVCHKLAHGERLAGCELPPLKIGHLIHLKAFHDVHNFSTEFLRRYNGNRALPPAEPLPIAYTHHPPRRGRKGEA